MAGKVCTRHEPARPLMPAQPAHADAGRMAHSWILALPATRSISSKVTAKTPRRQEGYRTKDYNGQGGDENHDAPSARNSCRFFSQLLVNFFGVLAPWRFFLDHVRIDAM